MSVYVDGMEEKVKVFVALPSVVVASGTYVAPAAINYPLIP